MKPSFILWEVKNISSGIIFSLLSWGLSFILSMIFSLILTGLNWCCSFLMKPFDFTSDMFVAVFGSKITENIINISISAGIAISVLLLVFGLLKVFTGKMSDDVPNPISLVGRFLIAIIANYWIISLLYDYIFPFAQTFFNKALSITDGQNLVAQNLTQAVQNIQVADGGMANQLGDALFDIGGTGALAFALKTSANMTIGSLIALIVFAVALIAVMYNIIKLVVENAERYFTINLLVLTGPVASSTIVSNKSSMIFKSWFQLLLSNILTVIFNIIGFRMIIFAFNNCMASWTTHVFQLDVAIVSLVALVAASKMVQKFDQLLSLVAFKINPIQNRSLLMSGLAGMTALNKGFKTITGKDFMSSVQNGSTTMNNKISQFARDGKFGQTMQAKQFAKDTAMMNSQLEKLGFQRNAMDKNGNIAIGNMMKQDNAKNVLNKINSTLEEQGKQVIGFEGSGDNMTLKTGEIGATNFEGKIAPDTLEAAFLGDDESKYTIIGPEGCNPTSRVPEGTYISGKETIQKVDEQGNVSFADKFYLSTDKNYSMSQYQKSPFDNKKI